jgi:hypothetical protein
MYILIKLLLQRLKGLPLFNKIVLFSLNRLTLPYLYPGSRLWDRYVQSIGRGVGIGGQTLHFQIDPRWLLLILLLLLFIFYKESSNLTDYFCLATPLYNVPTITHVMPPKGKVENLDLFGMPFIFNTESNSFCLVEKPMATEDLFNISNEVFDSLNSINRKGYVTLESLENSSHFIRCIEFHLVVLGYESKQFGDNNNTYSL